MDAVLSRLRRVDPLLAVATVAAITPIVVAAAAAIAGHWTAMGDNAHVLLRSRDVFTRHIPLVGARSSSGLALDFEFNSPGPLLYYLFAVPARLWGDAGLVVAVAAMAIASVVGVAYVLERHAGPAIAVLGLVAVTGLGWTMGRPLLVEPWQPHSLLHPFLLFLVLAWVTAAGDWRLLPWTAGVATLLLQSHLTYAYVVPAVSLAAVAGLAIGAAARRRGGEAWPEERRRLRRASVATGIVLAVLWLPTVVEQVVATGRGNLERVLDAARSDVPTVGAEAGVRRAAEVLALWPSWLRPSFGRDLFREPAPALVASVVGLAALAAVLGIAGWWSWRRRDRFALTGVVMASVAAAAAVIGAGGTIQTPFEVASHHVRYLWPVAIAVQLAVAAVAVRSLPPNVTRRVGLAATLLVGVIAAAAIPDVDSSLEPSASIDLGPVVRDLNAQLDPLHGLGTVLVEFPSQPFADPFGHPFVAELGRRGVDFVVRDPVDVRRYGDARAYDGHADAVVFLTWGPAALDEHRGAERIALASLLDSQELEAWRRLHARVMAAIAEEGIHLTRAGREAASDDRLGLPTRGGTRVDPRALYTGDADAWRRAVEEAWVRVPGIPADELREWYTLLPVVSRSTVAVWRTDPAQYTAGRSGRAALTR